MVGEFGEEIIEAPYMIEPIIGSYDDDLSPVVKLQLLVAAMKLFFKRPPEMQLMLGRLLKSAINDLAYQDVHDRALLYHRLLSTDVSTKSPSCISSLIPTTSLVIPRWRLLHKCFKGERLR